VPVRVGIGDPVVVSCIGDCSIRLRSALDFVGWNTGTCSWILTVSLGTKLHFCGIFSSTRVIDVSIRSGYSCFDYMGLGDVLDGTTRYTPLGRYTPRRLEFCCGLSDAIAQCMARLGSCSGGRNSFCITSPIALVTAGGDGRSICLMLACTSGRLVSERLCGSGGPLSCFAIDRLAKSADDTCAVPVWCIRRGAIGRHKASRSSPTMFALNFYIEIGLAYGVLPFLLTGILFFLLLLRAWQLGSSNLPEFAWGLGTISTVVALFFTYPSVLVSIPLGGLWGMVSAMEVKPDATTRVHTD